MIEDEEQARAFCADLTGSEGVARLNTLAKLLAAENERQNLVSAGSLKHIWQRHFADSLQLLNYVPHGTSPLLDLGSGAGFPGLALAAARPDLEVTLVESRKRRAEWLTYAADQLHLTACKAVSARLETVDAMPSGIITARAFAPLGKLLQLSARFSTPTTVWLLPKGRSAAQELAEQPQQVRNMFHVEPSATDSQGGILIGHGIPALS